MTQEEKNIGGNSSVPSHAQEVIIGGGVVGCRWLLLEAGWLAAVSPIT